MLRREQVAGTRLALSMALPLWPWGGRGIWTPPQNMFSFRDPRLHREKHVHERLRQRELFLCLARHSDIYLCINKPASRRFQSALFKKILFLIFMT